MIYVNYLAGLRILRMVDVPMPGISNLLAEERFAQAAAAVRQAIFAGDDPEGMARRWELLGDLQLLLGDFEAAESAYERSVALCEGTPLRGAASCRATGLLMLVRGRLETSACCFIRNVQSSDDGVRLEALAICALLFREGGLLDQATSFAAQLLHEAKAPSQAGWRYLGQTLARDIHVYQELLGQEWLFDHVYWHSARPGRASALTASAPGATVPPPLRRILERRQDQLNQLLAVQRGERTADSLVESGTLCSWPSSAAWQTRMNLQELALAALAANQPVAAAQLLARLASKVGTQRANRAITGVVRPAQIELVYCHAKSMMLRGLRTEGLAMYRQYLRIVLEAIRSLSATLIQLYDSAPQMTAASLQPDPGTGALLSQRYRRAYEYLLQHHARLDLSVHEIAVSIGVSERALQIRFKSAFGATPRELIRQLRSGDGSRLLHGPTAQKN